MSLQRITGKKKTLTTTLGAVSVNNTHSFSSQPFGFRLSSLLQELMVYAGTMDCYSKCQEVLSKFISVEVSDVQVWRVSESYGTQISQDNDKVLQRTLTPLRLSDRMYVEADGSMIFSREQGWKEVKVGRLFKASDCLHPEGKQGFIRQSQYVATLENSKGFCGSMERLLEDYGVRPSQLIFIGDGAPWLRNWISDAFSESVSILDFYHAAEHLHQFCKLHFNNQQEGTQWAEVQKDLLLRGQVKTVIAHIEAEGGKTNAGQALVEYYQSNEERMNYPYYQSIGCGIIGSGAIESAHRTVVQERMKLSGQRWSLKGAGHMLQLRVTYMNNQWNKIIELAKNKQRKAA